MEKRGIFAKVLAVIGAALVWFPNLAPVFVSFVLLASRGVFRFDYLIPAELFPVVLAGGVLLIWAAHRARSRQRLIGWGFGLAIVLLVAGQGIAVLTGLASGKIEPGGWQSALVLGSLITYDLAVILLGVGGILLLRDLFRRQ